MPISNLARLGSKVSVAKSSGASPGWVILEDLCRAGTSNATPKLLAATDTLRHGPDFHLAHQHFPLLAWPFVADLMIAGRPDVNNKPESKEAAVWTELVVNWGYHFEGPRVARREILNLIRGALQDNREKMETVAQAFREYLFRGDNPAAQWNPPPALIVHLRDMGLGNFHVAMFDADTARFLGELGRRVRGETADAIANVPGEFHVLGLDDLRAAQFHMGDLRTLGLMDNVAHPVKVAQVWIQSFFACVTCLTRGDNFTDQWLESRVISFKGQFAQFNTLTVRAKSVRAFCRANPTTGMRPMELVGILHGIHQLAIEARVNVFGWMIQQARLQRITGLTMVAAVLARVDFLPVQDLVNQIPRDQTLGLIYALVDALNNPWQGLVKVNFPVTRFPDWAYFAKDVTVRLFKEENMKNWQNSLVPVRSGTYWAEITNTLIEFQQELAAGIGSPIAFVARILHLKVLRARNGRAFFDLNMEGFEEDREEHVQETVVGEDGQPKLVMKTVVHRNVTAERIREINGLLGRHGHAELEEGQVVISISTIVAFMRSREDDVCHILRYLCEQMYQLKAQAELDEVQGVISPENLGIRIDPVMLNAIEGLRGFGQQDLIRYNRAIQGQGEPGYFLPLPLIHRPRCMQDEEVAGCGRDWFGEPALAEEHAAGHNAHVERQNREDLVHMIEQLRVRHGNDVRCFYHQIKQYLEEKTGFGFQPGYQWWIADWAWDGDLTLVHAFVRVRYLMHPQGHFSEHTGAWVGPSADYNRMAEQMGATGWAWLNQEGVPDRARPGYGIEQVCAEAEQEDEFRARQRRHEEAARANAENEAQREREHEEKLRKMREAYDREHRRIRQEAEDLAAAAARADQLRKEEEEEEKKRKRELELIKRRKEAEELKRVEEERKEKERLAKEAEEAKIKADKMKRQQEKEEEDRKRQEKAAADKRAEELKKEELRLKALKEEEELKNKQRAEKLAADRLGRWKTSTDYAKWGYPEDYMLDASPLKKEANKVITAKAITDPSALITIMDEKEVSVVDWNSLVDYLQNIKTSTTKAGHSVGATLVIPALVKVRAKNPPAEFQ